MASRSLERLKAADVAGAQAIFKSFEDLWSPVEDGVRAADPVVYARIEVAATRAAAAMEAVPPESARAAQALGRPGAGGGAVRARGRQRRGRADGQRGKPRDDPGAGARFPCHRPL